DALYETAGVSSGEGWTLEARVPLNSLRRPADADQRWGVAFMRILPRDIRRTMYSVPRDYDNPCTACQFDIAVVRGLKPARGFDVVAGAAASSGNYGATPEPSRERVTPSVTAGYNITPT